MKKIINVFATLDFTIVATFSDGKVKEFDVKLLMDKYEPFKVLKDDYGLFFSARVAPGGYAVVWNDELDISSDSVYYEGKKYDPKAASKKVMNELARYVRFIRKKEKISQKALSSMSGIPQPAIARIESGRSDPQISTLTKLLTPIGYTISIGKIEDSYDEAIADLALKEYERDGKTISHDEVKKILKI